MNASNPDPIRQRLEQILTLAESQPEKAIAELAAIVLEDRDSAYAWMAKGSLHFDRDEFAQSAAAFAEVIRLRPGNEFASAGLFHSLWAIGEQDHALAEIDRFFKIHGEQHHSELASEYRGIVRDLDADESRGREDES